MSEQSAFQAIVHGRVQGVYFRAFVEEHAEALGLSGYVRNLSGGRLLEVWAEGDKGKLEKLLNQIKIGPSRAKVERVDVNWSEYTGKYRGFSVNY
jgi:acylphosphatase